VKLRWVLIASLALAATLLQPPSALAVLDGQTTLADRLGRALRVQHVPRASTGALAIDLRTGRVAYGLHASLSLRPASNVKLSVALAALARLGPTYRIRTDVLGVGRREGAVWRGWLALVGHGDPSLSRRDLRTLARRIRALGIRRVTGRVVGDESYYDRRRVGPGWKPSFYKLESPPLSALVVNRAVVNRITVSNPAWAAAKAFDAALERAGVQVRRPPRVWAAPGVAPLTRISSPPLAYLVRVMNKRSDNFFAEMLLKHLGATVRGAGTTRGGRQVVRDELLVRGVPLRGVRIADGSGLSRYNRLTPRALAALLISARSDPAFGTQFVRSLPIAGVDGTLEDRMERPPARGHVRAKTGTLTTASALSGYVAGRYVFSVVQNGRPLAWWYARLAQDRFARALAAAAL
jgi:D-alanyl-D-alanine carboxypeptidase/D-alanyl-D-alanine-endopeptidase (penicillin-binding protein 4)